MGFFLFTKENIGVNCYKNLYGGYHRVSESQNIEKHSFGPAIKRNPLPETPEQRIV